MGDSPQERHAAAIAAALGVATAWRDREEIGSDTVRLVTHDAVREHGGVPMTYAFADLLTSSLSALEKSVAIILNSETVLRSALERLPDDPLRTDELDLDAETVLSKIGLWAASLPS